MDTLLPQLLSVSPFFKIPSGLATSHGHLGLINKPHFSTLTLNVSSYSVNTVDSFSLPHSQAFILGFFKFSGKHFSNIDLEEGGFIGVLLYLCCVVSLLFCCVCSF